MFTFYIQLLDVLQWHSLGLFFVFFITSWATQGIKVYKSNQYKNKYTKEFTAGISIIVPVVDEKPEVWDKVLKSLRDATMGLDNQIIVIGNGTHSEDNIYEAKKLGFVTHRISLPSKRMAIEAGAKLAEKPITIILDSDTIVSKNSIKELIKAFIDEQVGGATSKHIIFNRGPLMRRISDWLEDLRFNDVVKGQSVDGAVSCLPGRMFAMRTNLLKLAVPSLVSQKFLGAPCNSGDDRFLTSWLLRNKFKTVYVESSVVETDAPSTLKGFMMQRLRWSRTSFRESILSARWVGKHPYTAFTVFMNIFMRWFFFVVAINGVLVWMNVVNQDHYIWHIYPQLNNGWTIFLGVAVGFFISGLLRQLRHLKRYPWDIFYLPAFLLITTFVLTPVEWYGNLTIKENGWMTRRT